MIGAQCYLYTLKNASQMQAQMQAKVQSNAELLSANSCIASVQHNPKYINRNKHNHRQIEISTQCQRRTALLSLLTSPFAAPAAAAALTSSRDPTFYATWQYATPSDILPYIQQQAAPGDAQAVLEAMDTFSQYYPQYKIGPEKGALFEDVLQRVAPASVLEVGTFLGYSAIRIARHLQPAGGQLLCIEANPQNAAVAREVLQYAGLSDRVQVLDGLSSQVIPHLPQILAAQQQQQTQQQQQQQQKPAFDLVFLDHCKECYLPDLQVLEQLGLVQKGSTVVADNVIYPGAPGYLEFLEGSGRYQTTLLRARYEYEQAWNPEWEANKEDALSVSVCESSWTSDDGANP